MKKSRPAYGVVHSAPAGGLVLHKAVCDVPATQKSIHWKTPQESAESPKKAATAGGFTLPENPREC
jgi:hypothetical protein